MVSLMLFAVSLRISLEALATEITVISFWYIVKIWLKYNTSSFWCTAKLIIVPVSVLPLHCASIVVVMMSSSSCVPRFCLVVFIFACTKFSKSWSSSMLLYSTNKLPVCVHLVSCRWLVSLVCRYDGMAKLRWVVCTVCVGIDPQAVNHIKHTIAISSLLGIYWMNI